MEGKRVGGGARRKRGGVQGVKKVRNKSRGL